MVPSQKIPEALGLYLDSSHWKISREMISGA
jgi:hypothetical protein